MIRALFRSLKKGASCPHFLTWSFYFETSASFILLLLAFTILYIFNEIELRLNIEKIGLKLITTPLSLRLTKSK